MQNKQNSIHILFGATSDFLPYATVTARSISEKLNGRPVHIHFLYADIVRPISDAQRESMFEHARHSFDDMPVTWHFYDISEHLSLLDGQNVGMWGPEVSMTHYFYLLAPLVLPHEINRVIYLDTDMIVNCDLSDVFDMDMANNLLAMGAPRGFEEMGDDVSNSGFIVLNLGVWRSENTLETLLAFGRGIPRGRFCDQNLLYQYFTKCNPDRLKLVAREYNIFPQCFPEIPLQDIKVLHFTGYNHTKAWHDIDGSQRGSCLWWRYAQKTCFYQRFLFDIFNRMISAKIAVATTPKSRHHSFWWHIRHMKF